MASRYITYVQITSRYFPYILIKFNLPLSINNNCKRRHAAARPAFSECWRFCLAMVAYCLDILRDAHTSYSDIPDLQYTDPVNCVIWSPICHRTNTYVTRIVYLISTVTISSLKNKCSFCVTLEYLSSPALTLVKAIIFRMSVGWLFTHIQAIVLKKTVYTTITVILKWLSTRCEPFIVHSH